MLLRAVCVLIGIALLSTCVVYVKTRIRTNEDYFNIQADVPVRIANAHAPPVRRSPVFFCIPVKSTASMRTLHDTELVNTLFPSLAKSIILPEFGTYLLQTT